MSYTRTMKKHALISFTLFAIGLSLSQTSLAETALVDVEHAEVEGINDLLMTVYKSPTCGCCAKWVSHIEDKGFTTKVVEMNDLSPLKTKYDIGGQYRSCHTGVVITEVGEYVFEGHIPAEHVNAFLSNPPAGSIGLSVPGMPAGSPGMEMGDRLDYYQVLLLNQDGSSSIFAHVNE